MRAVAFDNAYGVIGTLPAHVQVDGAAERALMATCDPKTCSVTLVLPNGPHELAIAVEQNGRRSEPTVVRLDTTNLP